MFSKQVIKDILIICYVFECLMDFINVRVCGTLLLMGFFIYGIIFLVETMLLIHELEYASAVLRSGANFSFFRLLSVEVLKFRMWLYMLRRYTGSNHWKDCEDQYDPVSTNFFLENSIFLPLAQYNAAYL